MPQRRARGGGRGRGRGKGKGRGKSRGRGRERGNSKQRNNDGRSTTSSGKTKNVPGKAAPSFSEWIEAELERREVDRQALIRQREGLFEGPVVDILDMADTHQAQLMDLVRKGVVVVDTKTSTPSTQTSSSGTLSTGTTTTHNRTPQKELKSGETMETDTTETKEDDTDDADLNTCVPDPQLKEYLCEQLLFSAKQAEQALKATANAGLVPALDWLCLHTSDEELDQAFYGRPPAVTSTMMDELVERTTSISVRQFDFQIEVRIFVVSGGDGVEYDCQL